MAKKPLIPRVISPAGVAVYPWLNKADTEYRAEGTFRVKLLLDTDIPVNSSFIDAIEAWHIESTEKQIVEVTEADNKFKTAAAVKKICKDGDRPYNYVTDDEGEDTNMVEVTFKMNHFVTNKTTGEKYEFLPTFIDSAGQVIKGDKPKVFGGSVLKVRFQPILWNSIKLGASVQMRMDAFQIIELVSGGGANAEGFGDEGGGFVDDGATATAGFSNDSGETEPGGDEVDDSDGDF